MKFIARAAIAGGNKSRKAGNGLLVLTLMEKRLQ
jgi:hypothetical protein